MYYIVPVTNGVLDIDYHDMLNCIHFSSNKAIVQLVDTAIIRSTWTAQTATDWATYTAPTLAQAQQAKLAELGTAYQNSFTTFQSSALGTVHTYPINQEAQDNMNKLMNLMTLNPNMTTIQFKTIENGMTAHTRDQFIQVLMDAQTFEVNIAKKYEGYESQVNAATTVTQVQAVTWS